MNNYEQLVILIKAYFNNRDDELFISNISNFITQAQFRIFSELKDIGEQQSTQIANITLKDNVQIVEKPQFWNKTISIIYKNDENTFTMYPRRYEFCTYYSSKISNKSAPLFYCDNPNDTYKSFLIFPTPDKDYSAKINYYALPQANLLNTDNQTNWILQRFPNLLLYASILEATPFVNNDPRMTLWQGMYDRALEAARIQSKERHTDRSSTGGE